MKQKILNVILGVLFIFGVLTFVFTGSDATFGYTARIVISGSMEPAIPVYTVNIVKECDISDINKGDIILYRYRSDIIHRVVSVETNGTETVLITQGDANERPDEIEIKSNMVIGKVVKTLGWTRYILKPLKCGNRSSFQMILFICIIGIYILKVIVKRYIKIYSIYALKEKDRYIGSGKKIRDVYTNNKELWRMAENEYRANRSIEENSTCDKN